MTWPFWLITSVLLVCLCLACGMFAYYRMKLKGSRDAIAEGAESARAYPQYAPNDMHAMVPLSPRDDFAAIHHLANQYSLREGMGAGRMMMDQSRSSPYLLSQFQEGYCGIGESTQPSDDYLGHLEGHPHSQAASTHHAMPYSGGLHYRDPQLMQRDQNPSTSCALPRLNNMAPESDAAAFVAATIRGAADEIYMHSTHMHADGLYGSSPNRTSPSQRLDLVPPPEVLVPESPLVGSSSAQSVSAQTEHPQFPMVVSTPSYTFSHPHSSPQERSPAASPLASWVSGDGGVLRSTDATRDATPRVQFSPSGRIEWTYAGEAEHGRLEDNERSYSAAPSHPRSPAPSSLPSPEHLASRPLPHCQTTYQASSPCYTGNNFTPMVAPSDRLQTSLAPAERMAPGSQGYSRNPAKPLPMLPSQRGRLPRPSLSQRLSATTAQPRQVLSSRSQRRQLYRQHPHASYTVPAYRNQAPVMQYGADRFGGPQRSFAPMPHSTPMRTPPRVSGQLASRHPHTTTYHGARPGQLQPDLRRGGILYV